MKSYIIWGCWLGLVSMSSALWAQQSVGGQPASFGTAEVVLTGVKTLDPLNNEQLIEDEVPCPQEYEEDSTECANFFAIDREVEGTLSDGKWTTLSDGRKIWRFKVISPNAIHTGVVLENLVLPPGGKLFFYGENTEAVAGAYTSLENANGSLYSGLLDGSEVTIEYNAGPEITTLPTFDINWQVHAYRNIGQFGASMPCQNNVNCPEFEPWCDQIRSVVLVETPFDFTNINNITGVTTVTRRRTACSGALINNDQDDFRPLIFTARHCIRALLQREIDFLGVTWTWGNVDLPRTNFYFNYQSRVCDDVDLPMRFMFRLEGCDLLAQEWPVDAAMLELFTTPPLQFNVFYAGWNRMQWGDFPDDPTVTGIHHPMADIKKISEGELGYNHIESGKWLVDWNNGLVENGSSGSPLFFDDDRRIIGTLSWGTNDDCEPGGLRDRYGRLRSFWNNVDNILAPGNNNLITHPGIDPIEACQNQIALNGEFLPASLYRLVNQDITIQAATQIDVADLLPTQISNQFTGGLTFVGDYTFRAGERIQITGANGFLAENGVRFSMQIGDCETFEGCGPNYLRPHASTQDVPKPAASALKVYPNPTADFFHVEYEAAFSIQAYNVMGQQVQIRPRFVSDQHAMIDVRGLEAGLLILRIKSEGQEFVKRLVVK